MSAAMKLDACRSCGRIVLRGFSYCPYCGNALRPGDGIEEALRRPFERMEGGERRRSSVRIDRLIAELSTLECEMEELLHGSACR